MTTASSHHTTVALPILMTCVGYAFFNISDAAIKMVAGKYPALQTIFLVGAVIVVLMSAYSFMTQGRQAFRIKKPRWVWGRAGLYVIGALINAVTLPHVQLTTFYTLVFTSPFWVVLLSAIFLKERLEPAKIAVILFGFAVVVYIFQPGSGLLNLWSVLILVGTFLYSCSVVISRFLGPSESRVMLVISGPGLCMLAALPFLPWLWVPVTPYDWGVYLIAGFTTAVGVTAIIYAFQHARDSATIAPYHYTQIIWGVALGYFLFHDLPTARVMIGASLIIMAGLFLMLLERRARQA